MEASRGPQASQRRHRRVEGWKAGNEARRAASNALPMQICVTPAPAGPASSGWSSVTLVKGQQADPAHGVPWQGWYSQVYDDAWPAPTLLYDALQVRAKGRLHVSVSRGAVQLRHRSTCAGACLPAYASHLPPLSLAGPCTVRVCVAARADGPARAMRGHDRGRLSRRCLRRREGRRRGRRAGSHGSHCWRRVCSVGAPDVTSCIYLYW